MRREVSESREKRDGGEACQGDPGSPNSSVSGKKNASEKCLQEDQLKKTGMQVRLRACCVLPVAGVHEPVAKNVDGRGYQSAKDTQPGEASAL